MSVRKNFEFRPQMQNDLTWLQERLEAATEAETVRRSLSLLRQILEANDGDDINIRRKEPLPDLHIPL